MNGFCSILRHNATAIRLRRSEQRGAAIFRYRPKAEIEVKQQNAPAIRQEI
jgi:hypothetical protein